MTASPRKLDPLNTTFLVGMHLLGIAALAYLWFYPPAMASVILGVVCYLYCGLGITMGYHRLFAHPTYRASTPVKAALLLAGAGSVQNSALKWSSDHRAHHAHTDTDRDPYDSRKGLWWSHMGWIFYGDERGTDERRVRDLLQDPWLRWQDKHYVMLAITVTLLIPLALGSLWGDPIGAVLVAGILRLLCQWHATFTINSFAHKIGTRPYCQDSSARDSTLIALVSMGEGYHNFHHRFPMDYRNGPRWWQFDPTKWLVWSLSKVGLTGELKRTPMNVVQRERRAA